MEWHKTETERHLGASVVASKRAGKLWDTSRQGRLWTQSDDVVIIIQSFKAVSLNIHTIMSNAVPSHHCLTLSYKSNNAVLIPVDVENIEKNKSQVVSEQKSVTTLESPWRLSP